MRNRQVEEGIVAALAKLDETSNLIDSLKTPIDLSKTPPERKERAEDIINYLEARKMRVVICKDILNGRAFVAYDVDGDLVVVQPGDTTAMLVLAAEEHGCRVTKLGEAPKEVATDGNSSSAPQLL